MATEIRALSLESKIARLKHYEFGQTPPKYQPSTLPKYEILQKRKRIIRIGRKYRNCERAVKIGEISSPYQPFVRPLYLNPSERAQQKGKVTLAIASKGIGKTNLTRLYTQGFYRASNFPIVVFQEKRGDLDFTRRADPEKLIRLGIQPIRLPDDCQQYLIPGENYKIPLAELEYSELMDYIGKKVGSSMGDRILQRIWYDREGRNQHVNLDVLRRAVETYINQIEEREDTHVEVIRSTIERFLDLIELDRFIESERVMSLHDYIDTEKINIIDLSRIGDDNEKQFIVAATLRMLQRHFPEEPCFIALTEAHVYAPSNRQPASLSALMHIVTVLARSYGWNVLLETQSPQNLHPRILENVDELYVFGFVSKSKRQALVRNIQMNLEGLIDFFYYRVRDIERGEGIFTTINDPMKPYLGYTFLSPVG